MLATQESVTTAREKNRDVLCHWAWALPILLIVAALSLHQIDLVPPSTDEFWAMNDAGWISDGPYSPIEVMQSLSKYSANHTPGYFILLSWWGNVVGDEVSLGRVLGIFFTMLSLAMAYRLTSDFVAPAAGLFALIFVASNAYYNFFLPHVRMYPLLVFLSALVMWLYLRIVHQQRQVNGRDYFALAAASYALANTHAFSALLFIMLGIYHLLFAPKNRRWARVSVSIVLAILLFSPWIPVLATRGLERTFFAGPGIMSGWDVLTSWFTVSFNGSFLFALVACACLAVGVRAKAIKLGPYYFMILLFLLAFGIFAQIPKALDLVTMRYLLPGLPPLSLFVATGLYAVYRLRRWLGLLLILLWVAASISFHATTDWWQNPVGRLEVLHLPPWQVISRFVLDMNSTFPMYAYRLDGGVLNAPVNIKYTQNDFYFGRHGINLEAFADAGAFRGSVTLNAITDPSIWVLYQTSVVDEAESIKLGNFLQDVNYQLCASTEFGLDTILLLMSWKALHCESPSIQGSYRTEMLDYEFYGATVNTVGDRILFVDKWVSQKEFEHAQYDMSFQLISESWNNEAQVDLPLVHEDSLRQFSIGIADVPPGTYRLMAILYDKRTGENVDWIDNPGYVPGMMELSEIVIPQG